MGMKIWETGSNRQIDLVRTKKKQKHIVWRPNPVNLRGEKAAL